MTTDYQPVDCGLHSEYELAIMHASMLRVSWQDSSGAKHCGRLLPKDLYSRNGEEFMVALTPRGETLEIRLDRISGHTPA